jgi:hypothetical protein
MIGIERLLRPMIGRLIALNLEFAVVGGLAVSARTVPRFTKDVDLAILALTDRKAEQIIFDIARDGYQIVTLIEQTATGRLATARLGAADDQREDAVIDLLFASCGIEPEVTQAAEMIELFPGVFTPIATIGHLIAMKVLSRDDDTRPQDIIDLRALIVEASADDLAVARAALSLIAERGYHREKNLQADYATLLARFRPGG